MTNAQIIESIAIEVYGEEFVSKILEAGSEIPLHTIQGWAQRGPFRVKKGEHGIECKLWKKKKNKSVEGANKETTEISESESFYLCKSFLFTEEQIERVYNN